MLFAVVAHSEDIDSEGVPGEPGLVTRSDGTVLHEIDAGFAMANPAKRASHIDPPTSSNAIMRRAQPLPRREQ